jgi:hypothetical protein
MRSFRARKDANFQVAVRQLITVVQDARRHTPAAPQLALRIRLLQIALAALLAILHALVVLFDDMCCSKYGFCGSTASYCSISNGGKFIVSRGAGKIDKYILT